MDQLFKIGIFLWFSKCRPSVGWIGRICDTSWLIGSIPAKSILKDNFYFYVDFCQLIRLTSNTLLYFILKLPLRFFRKNHLNIRKLLSITCDTSFRQYVTRLYEIFKDYKKNRQFWISTQMASMDFTLQGFTIFNRNTKDTIRQEIT